MTANEEWYDDEIAPKLLELAILCSEREMAFLAVVEYDKGCISKTIGPGKLSLEMTMINHCAATAPNVDGYIIGLIRHCRERGIDCSQSMIISQYMNRSERRSDVQKAGGSP